MKNSPALQTEKEVSVKPLYFHIGWMRTGTTFLQGLFKREDKVNLSLKNRFFSYDPFFNRGVKYYQNEIIDATDHEEALLHVDSDENYSMGRFKTQIREMTDVSYNHRAELGFIYHDIKEMIRRMKQAAPDAKIFGVIRKQPSWFESVYKHDVYHFGLDQKFENFYESPLGQDYRLAADYFTVYKMFCEAFGKDNVKISLFEDFAKGPAAFTQDLATFLGTELALKDEKKLKKNASTSNYFTILHMYANRLCVKNPAAKESSLYKYSRKTVNKLDHLAQKTGLNIKSNIITHDMRDKIVGQYMESNEKLAKALGLTAKMKEYGYY